MPKIFRRTYEPMLQRWMDAKELVLEAAVQGKDWITGRRLVVSDTVYADDVKELSMVGTGRDAAVTIATSGRMLDDQLGPAKMKQNVSKAEHVPMFLGPGQEAATQDFKRHVAEHDLGQVKRQARYLGAQIMFNGSVNATVQARVRAAKEAFYGMGRMWTRLSTEATKRDLFKGLVLSTLHSGLEAEVLRNCDLRGT